MTRAVRMYGKKRGNRQVGAGPWGRLLLVLFFGFFFVAGIGFTVLLVQEVVLPQWRANHRFVETQAVVLRKRIGESQSNGSPTYRAEVLVEYEAEGQEHEAWAYQDASGVYSSDHLAKQAVLDRYEIGQTLKCWYDPQEPTTVCLARGYDWLAWTMLLLPLTFLAVGGGGLSYQFLSWSTSVERRLAMVQRVQHMELFDGDGEHARDLPAVPGEANLTNSPGTTLAYRLPISVTPGWALAVIMAACLFWNGMVALFVTIAVNSHLRGEPEWFLSLFLIPFVLVGLGLAWYTVRQILITTGVGPTRLEISAHPLQPAGEYEIFLSQAGRLTFHSLRVLLICEEQATYQQGTNSRTETCPVFQEEVFHREGFEVQRGVPLEIRSHLRVPPGAMHSFKSAHNEVRWKLIVKGDVRGWPNYEREFPLLVYPAAGGGIRGMIQPVVTVRLDDRRRHYRPGEMLCGEFRIETLQPDQIKAIELSVIWCTEGKGEEDVGLHYFQRYSPEEEPVDPRSAVRFAAAERLPDSPLSYEGLILKIRWCVRLRLFLPHGETLVHDEPFQLGDVPSACPLEPEEAPESSAL